MSEVTTAVSMITGEVYYTFVREVRVDQDTVRAIVENDGTAYWASDGEISAGGSIVWTVQEPHEYGDDGRMVRKYRATFDRIAKALVEIADGEHGLRDDLEEEAREILRDADAAIGAEVNDCVVQVALFGKVVYG
jgi:hypothetical protein